MLKGGVGWRSTLDWLWTTEDRKSDLQWENRGEKWGKTAIRW